MLPFIPFRWSILTAITLVGALSLAILGCTGGGGGGSSPVGAVDHSAITSTLRSFMMAASKGDLNAASQGLSPALRSSAAASSVIATFTFMDFGDDFYDRKDDGSWTFFVRNGGIVALSSDLAEVNAECLSRSGTLIKLYFRMIREQGTWLIDDVQLEGIQTDVVDAVAYFPLEQGNRWEYLESDGSGNTFLIIRTIASAPEIINGQTVYSIVQTSQPAPSLRGQTRPPANSVLSSRPSIAGTIRPLFQSSSYVERFSTNDGLYFYGADSSFNNNSPLEIIALNAVEGETTPSVISILSGGMRYEADVEILIKSTESFVTPIQTYDAIPVQITVTWRQVPPGETPQQRETWFVAQDVGLIGRQIHDPNNLDQILTSTTLQKAIVDGVTIGESPSGVPVIQSVYPAPGTTNVSPATSISADFNLPMDLASLQGGNFSVTISGSPVSGSISMSGNSAIFAPLSPLPDSALITATIATGTLDQTGKTLATGRTWTFTIAAPTIPSFVIGGNQTFPEDSDNHTVTNWVTGILVPSGNPVFTVTSNNSALFAVQPAVSSTGDLTFTSAMDANGQATISVVLGSDAPGVPTSAPQTSVITVTPVNDPPSFAKGPDIYVTEVPSPYSGTWATGITSGPTDESGQVTSFTVTVSSPASFSTPPVIDSNGTLSLTPMSANTGTFIASVTLSDNGGIANGGEDTSATQTFKITVTPSTVTLAGTYPMPNGFIPGDAAIILTFNQPMDLNDLVTRLTLIVNSSAIPLTVSDLYRDGNRVYITPPGGMAADPAAQLIISGGALGLSGAILTPAPPTITFSVTPAPAYPAPSITAPTAGAVQVAWNPTINGTPFGGSQNAADWEVYDSSSISISSRVWYALNSANYPSITVTSGFGTFANSLANATALNPGTSYWVRFRHLDLSYTPSAWSALSQFTTDNAPDAPSLITPTTNQVLSLPNPTVQASGFADPDAGDTLSQSDWEIYDSNDPSNSSARVWNSFTGTGTSIQINATNGPFANSLSGQTDLAAATTYYIRVRYLDAAGEASPWSDLVPFTAN